MDTLGKRLTWARERKGLTQEGLAKLGGVSQSTIGNLEAGIRQTARKIVDIAVALDVDPTWLANGRGNPGGSPEAAKREADQPQSDHADTEAQDDILKAMSDMIETYRLASPAGRHRIDAVVQGVRREMSAGDESEAATS